MFHSSQTSKIVPNVLQFCGIVALLCCVSTGVSANVKPRPPVGPAAPVTLMALVTPRASTDVVNSTEPKNSLFPSKNSIFTSSKNRFRRSYRGLPGPPGPPGVSGYYPDRGSQVGPAGAVGDSNMCRACTKTCYKRDFNCDCRLDFECIMQQRQRRRRIQRLAQRLR